jgi:membrane protease subunit HflC
MNGKIIGMPVGTLLLVVLGIGVLLISQAAYNVDERDQVIVTQFGQFVRSDREPGLHFKIPFYQTATRFDKRILVSDANPGEYLTLDKKRLVADHVTRWRIADPLAFYITVRDEVGGRARLDDIVFSEMRDEIAQHDFADIISTQRETIMDQVAARTAKRAEAFGIQVIDVRIKRADLPTEVQASVFARMVAERGRIAKRYRSEGEEEAAKIRAEADKGRTILLAKAYETSQTLRGEGDASATAIYAQAFGADPEFYTFIRSLDAYEKFLSSDTTLLLSTESDLFQYLGSAKAGAAPQAPR